MITRKAKSAGIVETSKANCPRPSTTASSSIRSGARWRSAITTLSSTTKGTISATLSVPSALVPGVAAETRETPSTTKAQNESTPVGCRRRKS